MTLQLSGGVSSRVGVSSMASIVNVSSGKEEARRGTEPWRLFPMCLAMAFVYSPVERARKVDLRVDDVRMAWEVVLMTMLVGAWTAATVLWMKLLVSSSLESMCCVNWMTLCCAIAFPPWPRRFFWGDDAPSEMLLAMFDTTLIPPSPSSVGAPGTSTPT